MPADGGIAGPDYGSKAFAERLSRKFLQGKRLAIANAAALKKS